MVDRESLPLLLRVLVREVAGVVTDYCFALQVRGMAAMVAATGSSPASVSERCSDGCDTNVRA